MKEKLITTREVSQILGLSEKEIIDLAHNGTIPHFTLGGEFLRFRKDEILKIKREIKRRCSQPQVKSHRIEKIKDFFYFNDFYILATAVIAALLWIILKDFRP